MESLTYLNQDVLCLVIRNLDIPSTGYFARTCSMVAQLVGNDAFWMEWAIKINPNVQNDKTIISWKNYVKENTPIKLKLDNVQVLLYEKQNKIDFYGVKHKSDLTTIIRLVFQKIKGSATMVLSSEEATYYYYSERNREVIKDFSIEQSYDHHAQDAIYYKKFVDFQRTLKSKDFKGEIYKNATHQ